MSFYKHLVIFLFVILQTGTIAYGSENDTIFVYLKNGGVAAHPSMTLLAPPQENDSTLVMQLLNGEDIEYKAGSYTEYSTTPPVLPTLVSLSFERENNSNLNSTLTIPPSSRMKAATNAIGKYLTPNFTLSDEMAIAFIGNTLQESNKGRLNFGDSIIYTVTYPNYNLIDMSRSDDEEFEKHIKPFGNSYTVALEWLADSIKQVPRIDIDIKDSIKVTSKEYYLKANFKITGYGMYEDFEDSVQIKGRGNSSWNYPKKPYRLKFSKAKSPFGLINGKSWILLANYMDGSYMCNAIAMKAGQLAGMPYTNHIIPVDLYMNGEYLGNYVFTEKIGISGNSVDINDEKGCLLEIDKYYDEQYKFRSDRYGLPVMVKDPDLTDFIKHKNDTVIYGDSIRLDKIKARFNAFEEAVYNGEDYDEHIDMETFAQFMFVNILTRNTELLWPKSTFIWNEEIDSADSKFFFGPLWDFDWGFGYNIRSRYYIDGTKSIYFTASNDSTLSGNRLFYSMMQNKLFEWHYYNVWYKFMEGNALDELYNYIDEYYNLAETSIKNDATLWDRSGEQKVANIKNWIRSRANYLYSSVKQYNIIDILYPTINDNDPVFANYAPRLFEPLTYKRNFIDTNWEALYIPFSIKNKELYKEFEVAEIHNILDDDMEHVELMATLLEESDTIEANRPYLIRAKENGEKIMKDTANLEYTIINSIDCSSANNAYAITGTYSTIPNEVAINNGYYILKDGALQAVNENDMPLGAFRWYLRPDPENGFSTMPEEISISITDYATTAIKDTSTPHKKVLYDLQGRIVRMPANGLYIYNGKKIYIRN